MNPYIHQGSESESTRTARSRKMRPEMVIGMEIGIINAEKIGLSSNATFEKRRRRIVVDAGFHFEIDVEPHLFRTGCRRSQLYMYIYINIYMEQIMYVYTICIVVVRGGGEPYRNV